VEIRRTIVFSVQVPGIPANDETSRGRLGFASEYARTPSARQDFAPRWLDR
jgi:hypothetical protein